MSPDDRLDAALQHFGELVAKVPGVARNDGIDAFAALAADLDQALGAIALSMGVLCGEALPAGP